jgi:hypothetical protein
VAMDAGPVALGRENLQDERQDVQRPPFQEIPQGDWLAARCGGPHISLQEPQDPSMAATSSKRGRQRLPAGGGRVEAPWCTATTFDLQLDLVNLPGLSSHGERGGLEIR